MRWKKPSKGNEPSREIRPPEEMGGPIKRLLGDDKKMLGQVGGERLEIVAGAACRAVFRGLSDGRSMGRCSALDPDVSADFEAMLMRADTTHALPNEEQKTLDTAFTSGPHSTGTFTISICAKASTA